MDKPYEKSLKVEAPAKVEVKVGDVPAETELEPLKSGDPCPNRDNKYFKGPHRGQVVCKEGRVISSPSESEVLVCGECGARWLSDRTAGPSAKLPPARTDREIAAPHGPDPWPEPSSIRRSAKGERVRR